VKKEACPLFRGQGGRVFFNSDVQIFATIRLRIFENHGVSTRSRQEKGLGIANILQIGGNGVNFFVRTYFMYNLLNALYLVSSL